MSVNDNIIKLPTAKLPEDHVQETVPLFELDGEVYSMPKEPPAGVALKYLRISTEQGQDPAAYFMLTTMLGEDAYNALAEHPTLTTEQFDQIFKAVEKHALGGGKGK